MSLSQIRIRLSAIPQWHQIFGYLRTTHPTKGHSVTFFNHHMNLKLKLFNPIRRLHSNSNSNSKHGSTYYFRCVSAIISGYVFNSYTMAMTLGLSLTLYQYFNEHNNNNNNSSDDRRRRSIYRVKACGIIGMIGEEEVQSYLMEGLSILQNRGYDSAGCATIHEETPDGDHQSLRVTKYASRGSTSDSLEILTRACPTEHENDKCGIAHTRWATHGGKTDANAHPHCDYKGRIALVHNGTIENCHEIKQELKQKGIEFLSQTDTEVIANLVGYYMDTLTDEDVNDLCGCVSAGRSADRIECSLKKALSRLDGSWGIALIAESEPDKIYAARYGSPLMIGLDPMQNRNFIASEHSAFARYTNEYISLEDGEVAIIGANDVSISNKDLRIETTPANMEAIQTSPAPYPHWTIKEIFDEPQAISRALAYGSRLTFDGGAKLGGLESHLDLLSPIKNLIITGCGTSLYAGIYGKKLMQYLKSFETVSVYDSAEVVSDCLPTNIYAGLLAISQSGETKDVVNALKIAEKKSIPRFSIVNVVGSLIARMTGLGVYTYAGREYAVASTKAFVSQVTVLALIAAWFAQINHNSASAGESHSSQSAYGSGHHIGSDKQRCDKLIEALHRLPTYCGATIENCHASMKTLAAEIVANDVDHMFVLGKGFAEPIAYESALKLKEITYIHAEGFSGGALKHGPFALIEEGTPVIMIILDDEHSKVMVTNAHEIEARGGSMIYITDNASMLNGLKTNHVVQIPSNGCLTALLSVLPVQLLAYEIAVQKGINPDKPKNLAKAVTVV